MPPAGQPAAPWQHHFTMMTSGVAALVDDVIGWYGEQARDLPWRRPDTSPWAVLVSEVMLQQTPVRRVRPVWEAWLRRWPEPAALAADTPGQAIRAWGRLGYPRRALRLHAAATVIRDRYAGAVPADLPELQSLPGIGAYTARAVACFAFGRRVPVVDTNVRRFVARAVAGQAAAAPPAPTRDLAVVAALLPSDPARAARFSAAAMELGAVVCTARAPACGGCPVRAACAWQRTGRPAHVGPTRPPQRFEGTDRQVRGRILELLRRSPDPVPAATLHRVGEDCSQRDRARAGLIADGLLVVLPDGRYALPGG